MSIKIIINTKFIIVVMSAVVLTACGGGGDGSSALTPASQAGITCAAPQILTNGVCVSTSPIACALPAVLQNGSCILPVATTPPPTVSLFISQQKISVGSSATVRWSSTNATSCVGLDALSGAKAINSSEVVTATAGGQFTYTISCSGASGSISQSVAIVVPLPVYKTSYENKNNIALDDPKIPSIFDIKGLTREVGEQSFSLRTVAFADFMQDGSLTAITASTFYNNIYPTSNAQQWPDSPAKLYVLKKNSDGLWSDVTPSLFKDSANRYICISPGFIQIADFNNDGKPDAYFSCTGLDYPINGVWNGSSLQYVMLSQSDGTYKITELPIPIIYSHQSSAADFDGDGNIDVISVNPRTNERPLILFGNGDGTFRLDKTRFPSDMTDKAIFGIMAVPVNGNINVLVSGNAPGWTSTSQPGDYGFKVLQYKGGTFQYIDDLTSSIPKVSQVGTIYQLGLDAIYSNENYYTIWYDGTFQYSAVVKINAITGASNILSESKSSANISGPSMIIKLTSNNNIVSQMSACNQYSKIVGNYYYYECTYSIIIN